MTQTVALDEVLAALGDAVLEVHGPRSRSLKRPIPLDATDSDSGLAFCNKPQPDAASLMAASGAEVIICSAEHIVPEVVERGKTLVVVSEPRLAFLRVVKEFWTVAPPPGIHPTAFVADGADVSETAHIGPFCYVGRAVIGSGTILEGHVHVGDGTHIGRNVVVHPGTVIGSDGFGYQRNERGGLEKFPHIGGVRIEDDVEIGANTCIDRGTLGDTLLRHGCRIDNLVHIAHNVVIGAHAAVIAHAMIGGSTRIGSSAWIAPSACVRDGLRIGDGATVGLGAVVVKDVPDGATVMGAPARPASEYKAMLAALRSLGQSPDR